VNQSPLLRRLLCGLPSASALGLWLIVAGSAPVSGQTLEQDFQWASTLEFPVNRAHLDELPGLPARARTFLTAWIFYRSGKPQQAQKTYERALKLPFGDRLETWLRHRLGIDKVEFRSTVAAQIETTLFEQADSIESWAQLSRTEMLGRFERLQRCFPKSRNTTQINETVDTLRSMIAEDQRRAPLNDEAIARLPKDRQVTEWIYNLRDEIGGRGSGGIWRVDHKPLETLGYEAVPALIAALDDSRFTRGQARIRHAAAWILRTITGEDFGGWAGRSGFPGSAKPDPAVKKAAEAWWTEFQEIGEVAQLIKGIETGDRTSSGKAHRLIRLRPELAADAIWKGMLAATNIHARPWLVEKLVSLRNPKAKAYQWQEMRKSPNLTCRELCAQSLFHQGHRKEAIAAMLGEWRNRNHWLAKDTDHNPNFPSLLEFLLTCNDPAVIREIHAEYPKLPSYLRSLILRQFAVYRDVMGAMDTPRYSAPFRAAVFDLLTTGLTDTAIRWTGHSSQSRDWVMSDTAQRALAKWRSDMFKLPTKFNTFVSREKSRQLFWILAQEEMGKPATRLGDPLSLSDVVPPAGSPVNRVVNVVGTIKGLNGTDLTAENIESIMLSFMSDKEKGGHSFGLLVIRHENAGGVTVIAESTNELDQPPHRWKTILDNLVERGPSQLLDDSSYLGEPDVWAKNFSHSRSILSDALLNPSAEECRIRRVIIR